MLLAKYDAKQEWKEWCQNKDLSWGGQDRAHSRVWAVASQDLENRCCCLNIQDSGMGAALNPCCAAHLFPYLPSIALGCCWGLWQQLLLCPPQ